MVQKFELYVVSAYHPEHGLQSYVASIEENADWFVSLKQTGGWITHKRGLRLGDYGFPGQMAQRPYNPVLIIGDICAEALERVREAIDSYSPNSSFVEVVSVSEDEELKQKLEDCREHENNCEGRRVTLEAAFDRVYRLLKTGAVNNNDLLFKIQSICREVIDPAVLEDIDGKD